MSGADVAERLHHVRERIAAAGGDVDRICVVAVTKGFGTEAVLAAVGSGLDDIGENYAGELASKHASVVAHERRCRWHFLGHIQRRKVREVAEMVHLWQGVDRIAVGEELARRAPGAAVLVQVNISAERAKNGCTFEAVPALVDGLGELGLSVRGLMAVGPTGPPENARHGFRRLVTLAERLQLAERSIGMTDDLEVAVQEGTTMVRLGRALFGERVRDRLRR